MPLLSKLQQSRTSRSNELQPLRVLLLGKAVLASLVLIALSELGETVRYRMETMTYFKIRQQLGYEPEFSKRLKVFIYDDPTVAALGDFDISLGDWAKVFAALNARKPAAILVDKLFDRPLNLTQASEFSDTVTNSVMPIRSATFFADQEIPGRKRVDIGWAINNDSSIAWLGGPLKYSYGAHPAIAKALQTGHVRYEGMGMVRPFANLQNKAIVPHLAFSFFDQSLLSFEGEQVRLRGETVPISDQGLMRVNLIDRQTMFPKTLNMVALVNRARRGAEITPVNQDDIVVIIPNMYTGSTDRVDSPLGVIQGGFVVTALVNSILTGNYIRAWDYNILFMLVFAVIGAFIGLRLTGIRFGLAVFLTTLFLWSCAQYAFIFFGLETSIFFPLLAFNATAIVVMLERSRLNQIEQTRLERELQTSQMVQQTFLSYSDPQNPHIELEHFFKSATECSGDWWGHFAINERTYCIIITDAVGHGTPAALMTAMAYSSYSTIDELNRNKALGDITPSMILDHFNHVFFRAVQSNYHMTGLILFLDTVTGHISLANAGHSSPYIIRKESDGKRICETLFTRGSPLGISADSQFENKSFQMNPNDRLVLFTDGIYEVKNQQGQQLGKRALRKFIEKFKSEDLRTMKDQVVDSIFTFMQNEKPNDDMTFVTLEWRPES